jgi:hypothetical protein
VVQAAARRNKRWKLRDMEVGAGNDSWRAMKLGNGCDFLDDKHAMEAGGGGQWMQALGCHASIGS